MEEAERAKADGRISEESHESVMIDDLKGVEVDGSEGRDEGSDGEYEGGLDGDSDMGGVDSEIARLLG